MRGVETRNPRASPRKLDRAGDVFLSLSRTPDHAFHIGSRALRRFANQPARLVIYGETEHRTVYSTSDTISGLAVDPRVHAAIHRERFPVSQNPEMCFSPAYTSRFFKTISLHSFHSSIPLVYHSLQTNQQRSLCVLIEIFNRRIAFLLFNVVQFPCRSKFFNLRLSALYFPLCLASRSTHKSFLTRSADK